MRIDKNIIDAVKAKGYDRIVVAEESGLVFSCKVTQSAKFGENGAVMQGASMVNGAKSILFVGDIVVNGSYIVMDLKDVTN